MPLDLLDSIATTFDDDTVAALALTFSTEPESLVHDLPVISAAIVAGLIKKSSTSGGVATISRLLSTEIEGRQLLPTASGHDVTGGDVLASPDDTTGVEQGMTALDRIFGSGLDDLIGAISGYCKLPKYRLKNMFGAVGKKCLSSLADVQTKYSLESEDVATLILMQAPRVSDTLPDNLFAALGLRRQSSYATKLKEARSAQLTALLNPPPAVDVEKTLLKRVLPMAIVAIILVIAWILLKDLI